uniref:Uncharacterized protein n=1 Tax=Anguilla anguilla TaxID=7936 RepID=A0A0E9TXM9_ANGAN
MVLIKHHKMPLDFYLLWPSKSASQTVRNTAALSHC